MAKGLAILLGATFSVARPLSPDIAPILSQDLPDAQACSLLQVASSNSLTRESTSSLQAPQPEFDWQKEWWWNFCNVTQADIARCCAKVESNVSVDNEIQKVILLATPKTATVDLKTSLELWSHCRGKIGDDQGIERYHFAEDVDPNIFKEYNCSDRGGCYMISTFRKPSKMLVSAYLFITCSRDRLVGNKDDSKCERMASFDQDALLEGFFNYVRGSMDFQKRYRNYYQEIAALLEEHSYPALVQLQQYHYDQSSGSVELELHHVDGGKPMHWLLLDFEQIESWTTIVSNYAPGFLMFNAGDSEHHIPARIEDAYKSQGNLLRRLLTNESVWPADLLQEITSWDVTQMFYAGNAL